MERIKKVSDILRIVKDAPKLLGDNDEDLNLEQFLQELGISLNDYENSLKISPRGDRLRP